jgi:hypothetical protein
MFRYLQATVLCPSSICGTCPRGMYVAGHTTVVILYCVLSYITHAMSISYTTQQHDVAIADLAHCWQFRVEA